MAGKGISVLMFALVDILTVANNFGTIASIASVRCVL